MFEVKTQINAFTILLLLGESLLWKMIWGRFRSSRRNWRQWIFAISPGWASLAVTVFTFMNGSDGSSNLIFDRPPSETVDTGLVLTHLSSGASHPATHVLLQNIWTTWIKGPRNAQRRRTQVQGYNISKETGLVDVDIASLQLENPWVLTLQMISLFAQFIFVIIFAAVWGNHNYEPVVTLSVALIGQLLLVVAITPRQEAWMPPDPVAKRPCPIMLHKGLESSSILIVRAASNDGIQITLEQFCFESSALRNHADNLQLFCAGLSCGVLIMHIVLVSWMTEGNKLVYFFAGLIGLIVNIIEGASQPRWTDAYKTAFKGEGICSPLQSRLMAAVAVLVAGRFPAREQAAKLLYPSNVRFDQTLTELDDMFTRLLCDECREKINPGILSSHTWDMAETCVNRPKSCVANLVEELNRTPADTANRQKRDAICSVYHCIRRFAPATSSHLPQRLAAIDSTQVQLTQTHMEHNWQAVPLQRVVTGPMPAARTMAPRRSGV